MKRLNPHSYVSVPRSCFLLTAASLALTVLLFFLQPSAGAVWRLTAETFGLVFLLNWLPVLWAMLALFFLSGNVWSAFSFPALVFVLFSVVNRYMAAMRWSPLRPSDLLLGAEFLGIAKSMRPSAFILLGLGIAAFGVVYTLGLRLLKNNRPVLRVRLAGLAVCAGACVILNAAVYANPRVYAKLPSRAGATANGFIYGFLYAWNTERITEPAEYGEYKDYIETAGHEAASPAADRSQLPNIVMVLSEAFSEIPLNPQISFEGFDDPLRHYRQIKTESLYGSIVVPHVGGGTSDTEFDILTGISSHCLKGVAYAFTQVKKAFPGFTAVLKTAGYTAIGQHPGAGWFYNRQQVYPLLGFDAFYASEYYDANDTKGLYPSERQTIDKIIETYQGHMENADTPLFLDSITIQNHGPYNGKYRAAMNFETELSLSAADTDALANYFEGIKDCDEGLFRLTEYFKTVDAPTVLIYYGDHLPSLTPALWQALVPEADEHRFYRTPFLIWANESAQALLQTEKFEASLPDDRSISAHYLGAAVLEMAGLSGIDPFMDYLNEIRAAYPVLTEPRAEGGDAPEDASALALYRSWAYYRITN